MTEMFTIGKRLIPADHIALVELFEPGLTPKIQTSRDFKARVVLINRDSFLIEETVEVFANDHGFRGLPDEPVAVNPRVRFSVETFKPVDGFTPTKPYLTRLLWRDLDGNDQSKLLLSKPEVALAIAVTGDPVQEPSADNSAVSGKRPRSGTRRKSRQRTPVATV
ncbi:hypothetical protein [Rhodoplanes sp. SY1]|uniref:hypothetical protein n=1 Tax=Rhodoplanes sp. SY1 TaxID=3166646 RepID=UPI0038B56C7E